MVRQLLSGYSTLKNSLPWRVLKGHVFLAFFGVPNEQAREPAPASERWRRRRLPNLAGFPQTPQVAKSSPAQHNPRSFRVVEISIFSRGIVFCAAARHCAAFRRFPGPSKFRNGDGAAAARRSRARDSSQIRDFDDFRRPGQSKCDARALARRSCAPVSPFRRRGLPENSPEVRESARVGPRSVAEARFSRR